MTVVDLANDSEYMTKLTEAGQKLVVVDFYATWCGPCNMIAPFYKQLSTKYPNAVFLKVDVDKCSGTAAANSVSAMPTFVFFRNRTELERISGADKNRLEDKVKQFYAVDSTSGAEGAAADPAAAAGCENGLIDLIGLINKSQSECLNESDDHTFMNALNTASSSTFLKSDCDEQLILNISFLQAVKLHSLIIQGPEDNGPKQVKLFINQTKTLDFDTAMSMQSVQTLELKPEELKDNFVINLRYVKFQNVQSITLFFVNNQSSSEETVINYLKFIGTPISVTNMSEFKRVAGQAGEAHG